MIRAFSSTFKHVTNFLKDFTGDSEFQKMRPILIQKMRPISISLRGFGHFLAFFESNATEIQYSIGSVFNVRGVKWGGGSGDLETVNTETPHYDTKI